jgi:hypothetical protein
VFIVIYLLTKNKYLSDTIRNNENRIIRLDEKYKILISVFLTTNPEAMKKDDEDEDEEQGASTPGGTPPPKPPGGGGGQ